MWKVPMSGFKRVLEWKVSGQSLNHIFPHSFCDLVQAHVSNRLSRCSFGAVAGTISLGKNMWEVAVLTALQVNAMLRLLIYGPALMSKGCGKLS